MATISPSDAFLFGDFRLDRRSGGLFRCIEGGEKLPVVLGSRALDVLSILVMRQGELVSKDEIMAAVWPDTVVEEANLTVQISTLRRALGPAPSEAGWIQTVPARGYRFVVPVTKAPEPAPAEAPGEFLSSASPRSPSGLRAKRITIAALMLVGVVAIGWSATRMTGPAWYHPRSSGPRLSIVVLPFANLGNDPEQDYFAEAITGDLTTDLSRIAGSVVIAHSTAQSYRDKPVDVRQIGHDLDVRFVLEGSVRRMGEAVQVNAQLIDAETGTHLWADRFETNRRNLARAQSEITDRLANTLNIQLVEAAGRRIEREQNTDPGASDLAMRGWVLWFRPFSPANREAALTAFERSLEIDPSSNDARIGIATILVSNIGIGSSRSPSDDAARADRLLLQAIEQDAGSSRAHETRGTLRRIQNRLDEARIEFETAVALDRNNPHALLGLGQTLMFLGRPADGLPAIEASLRIDPRDPNIAFGHWSLGTCHLLLDHLDAATDLLRRARAENPRVYFFHLYLAGALGMHGDIDDAQAALTEAIRLKPAVNSLAQWAAVQPWISNPAFIALRDRTLDTGLRRAGMPDH